MYRPGVLEHQARILGRIADEIDTYRNGGRSAERLLNNIAGLIGAAEVQRTVEWARVEELYYAASNADEARNAWMPAEHRTTDADFEAALDDLRSWTVVNTQRDPET